MSQSEEVLLPTLLKKCGMLINADIDTTLKRHSIARSQYRVLYHVSRQGGLTQTELMKIMGVKAPTLTSIVDVLVKHGQIIRSRTDDDQRMNRLYLTQTGVNTLKQIPHPALKLNKVILEILSKEEAKSLTASLNKIISKLS
jgi:MarR family transcriptional regulator, transcriptional regulator for hemolysin